jgi:outer membrane biosynthesis protein TonB
MPATFRWLGLALLGIVIAAGVSIAASSLASRQIGLASEPISAGDALAPATRTGARQPQRPAHEQGRAEHHKQVPVTPPTPAQPPEETPTPEETTTEPQPPAPPPSSPGDSGPAGGDHAGGGGSGGADD